MADWTLHEGDALAILPILADASVDAVITDPPYPEIDREYGRWTEVEWWDLMMGVCREVRRVLKPTGSAVFVLQPNSEHVGRMRGWLWEFMVWACREWNVVQDAYWWNHAAMPCGGTASPHGLMRPSLKTVAWLGNPDCYRRQEAVLWMESQANVALRTAARSGRTVFPSGQSVDEQRISGRAAERGGTVPFNVLPIANTASVSSAGAEGHGAGTPLALMRWWVRYICPPGGTILDPFAGSGTAGIAAHREDRRAVMIERHAPYCEIIRRRMAAEEAKCPLFDSPQSESQR